MRSRWKDPPERDGNGGWTDWIPIPMKTHRIACCDCGLVHDLEFDVDERGLLMRAKRHNRATAQMRRYRHAGRPEE